MNDFAEAIRLDPQYAEAFANRAGAFLNLGMTERALGDLDHAIGLDPGLIFAYANRAIANLLLNRLDQVQADVDKAVELGADPEALAEVLQSVVAEVSSGPP